MSTCEQTGRLRLGDCRLPVALAVTPPVPGDSDSEALTVSTGAVTSKFTGNPAGYSVARTLAVRSN